MNRKSWGLLAALSGMALSVPGMAMAAEPLPTPTATPTATETQTTPAQDATAEAVALKVGDIVAAGETSAKASPSDGEATANALAVGGKPLAEQFGGTAKGNGSKNGGGLLDTDETPLGRIRLTPWEAQVSKADCQTADGKAAVARAVLVNPDVLALNLLQSESSAKHCGMNSTGSGSSDGATVNLGGASGVMLTLLHSEAASGSKGETYLLNINDNKVGTNDQVGADTCALNVPGLLGVTCLAVGGGQGSVFSHVADLTLGDGALTAQLVSTEGQAATGAAPSVKGAEFTPPADQGAPAASAGGSLARTGVEIGGLALAGAGLVAAGSGLVAAQRKRRLFSRA